MKIKRNSKQIARSDKLKLHEVMYESDMNPILFMPVDRPDMSVGDLITRQNEVNDIHADGEFDKIVENSSHYYPFFLKLEASDNLVEMIFDGDEIRINNETDAETTSLLKIAASLDADLLDRFNKVIEQPIRKKSFFSFLGI